MDIDCMSSGFEEQTGTTAKKLKLVKEYQESRNCLQMHSVGPYSIGNCTVSSRLLYKLVALKK